MATLNSTTYGLRTGQTFNTTDWPTQSVVSQWCTLADEIFEAVAGTSVANARSTNAATAILVLIVKRIQHEAERIRYAGAADRTDQTSFTPEQIITPTIERLIARAVEPDEIPFGSFKLVKDTSTD